MATLRMLKADEQFSGNIRPDPVTKRATATFSVRFESTRKNPNAPRYASGVVLDFSNLTREQEMVLMARSVIIEHQAAIRKNGKPDQKLPDTIDVATAVFGKERARLDDAEKLRRTMRAAGIPEDKIEGLVAQAMAMVTGNPQPVATPVAKTAGSKK